MTSRSRKSTFMRSARWTDNRYNDCAVLLGAGDFETIATHLRWLRNGFRSTETPVPALQRLNCCGMPTCKGDKETNGPPTGAAILKCESCLCLAEVAIEESATVPGRRSRRSNVLGSRSAPCQARWIPFSVKSNLDDCPPGSDPRFQDRLKAAGQSIYHFPVTMKKGRPNYV